MSSDDPDADIECSYCSETFPTDKDRLIHLSNTHADEIDDFERRILRKKDGVPEPGTVSNKQLLTQTIIIIAVLVAVVAGVYLIFF